MAHVTKVAELLDTLAEVLDTHEIDSYPLEALHGYVTAAVCAPPGITVTAQSPGLFADEDEEATFPSPEVEASINAILADLQHEIGAEILEDRFGVIVSVDEEDEAKEDISDWCLGFQHGTMYLLGELIAEPDDELEAILLPVFYLADPEAFAEHLEPEQLKELEDGKTEFARDVAQRIYQCYDRWHVSEPITVEKGPGRNDACPCGSGKKYKKCCGEEK